MLGTLDIVFKRRTYVPETNLFLAAVGVSSFLIRGVADVSVTVKFKNSQVASPQIFIPF